MTKIFTTILILISAFYIAQLSTTIINFNNYVSSTNNDLKNNFLPTTYYNLTQSGTNYFVTVPLLGTPIEPITYCSKYQGVDTEIMSINLDYKLELYQIGVPNSNAVGISLKDNNNSLVLQTRIYNQQLIIDGLSNPSSTYSPTLTGSGYTDGNWYRLSFEISKIATNKFSITTKVYNLGQNGQSTPSQVLAHTVQGFNYSFKPTDIVNVNLFGGWWGDVRYIDNFSIYGLKNGSICQALGVNESSNENQNAVYPNPFTNSINLKGKYSKLEIYDYSGKLIKVFLKPENKIDLQNFDKGVYILKMHNGNQVFSQKIVKNN